MFISMQKIIFITHLLLEILQIYIANLLLWVLWIHLATPNLCETPMFICKQKINLIPPFFYRCSTLNNPAVWLANNILCNSSRTSILPNIRFVMESQESKDRIRISRSQSTVCEAFWQFANEFSHFFWKLWIIKIRYFMNFQSHSLNWQYSKLF